MGNHDRPVHDLTQYNIPPYQQEDKRINLEAWRKLINQVGMEAVKNFGSAHNIEALGQGVPKDSKELSDTLAQITYKRFKENDKMALLFKSYNVDENTFDRCLDLKENGTLKATAEDKLPNVIVDCGKLSKEAKEGYYMVKLPKGDDRGLILGKITDCFFVYL